MSLVALPTGFHFDSHGWEIDVPQQVTRGWSKRRKVVGLPGAETWRCTLSLEPVATELDERQWRAFVVEMQGQENHVHIPANCQQPPAPSCTVRAGATNGYNLPLGGLPASSLILSRGEYMTAALPSGHFRMVMLMADLVSNGAGQATATFKPALNEAPTVGAIVELANPFCPMSFTESRNGWGVSDGLSSFSFAMEEAL